MSEFGLGRRPRRPDGQRDTGETEQEGEGQRKGGRPEPSCVFPPKKGRALASTPKRRGHSFPRILVVPRILIYRSDSVMTQRNQCRRKTLSYSRSPREGGAPRIAPPAAQGRMGGSGVSQQAEGGGGGWRGPGPLPWLLQEGMSEVGPASWSKVVIGEFE